MTKSTLPLTFSDGLVLPLQSIAGAEPTLLGGGGICLHGGQSLAVLRDRAGGLHHGTGGNLLLPFLLQLGTLVHLKDLSQSIDDVQSSLW